MPPHKGAIQLKSVVRQAVAITAAAVLLLSGASRIGYAEGLPRDPGGPPGHEPRNIRCPEEKAPYYLYRFPVLISDDSGDTRDWYGWYYATGCAYQLTARGEAIGKTYANLPVDDQLHPFDQTILRDIMQWNAQNLLPVQQALQSVGASDFLRENIPDPIGYSAYFKQAYAIEFNEPLPTLTVPQLGERMKAAGFQSTRAPSELLRELEYILLDTSRTTVGANALIDWWDLHGRGEFFNFDPSGAARIPEAGGGIMRITLFPVDWENKGGKQIGTDGKEAVVRVTIRLGYSSKRRQTPVAWRWKGESEWHEAGVADLDPFAEGPKTFRVPLPAQPRAIEVKVNYREDSPPHELSFANNTAEVLISPPPPPPPPAPAAPACTALNAGIDIKGSTWRTGDEVPVVFWAVRDSGGPAGALPVRVTVSVGGQSQTRTASLGPGKGTSGQVLYVPGSAGRLTASLRAEVQGAGPGCRTVWTASDSANVIPPPPDMQWTKPDTGVRLWDWR